MTLRGWVRTARHSKGVSFLEVSDGSCFAGLQVVAAPELENFEAELCHLQTGCAVSVAGDSSILPERVSGSNCRPGASRWSVRSPKTIRCRRSGIPSSSCAPSRIYDRVRIRWARCFGFAMPPPWRFTNSFKSAVSCCCTRRSSRHPMPRALARCFGFRP